jgi:hypothetical protein
MLNAIKGLFVAAIALGTGACTASTDSGAQYVQKRVSMGPRPDQYVLVRADQAEQADRPYALTGEARETRVERPAQRPTPSHPKGTHGQY